MEAGPFALIIAKQSLTHYQLGLHIKHLVYKAAMSAFGIWQRTDERLTWGRKEVVPITHDQGHPRARNGRATTDTVLAPNNCAAIWVPLEES